ncbi:MAG: VOC family protein [Bacteroidales bacterium]|jgi:catechol 2,3-dioxygenase-like lactoylglutathione lyase family enzyme|nr:VOC family protein [Bacteroidales bacterium]MBP7037544.1 VOC family protein [Bacteroidales bacterium]MDI9552167.1 VOC family protein [Bacteroidota bacterium]NLK54209.1 VOC family protein [Bacteroidales bacterium]
MKKYKLGGIQQVGIGVKDLGEAWRWYSRMFGTDCRVFDDRTEASLMLPYTGNVAQRRHAILALNLQSGGGFEVWQYTERKPVSIKEEIRLGDLGILVCKIKVKNIAEAYSFYRDKGCELSGEPAQDPAGQLTFFIRDPFGNLFQILEGNNWFMNENKISGGAYGAIFGVTDIDKSLTIYSDILGYDRVVYDKTGIFPDLASLPGGEKELRRVLLKRTIPFSGYFNRIFGQSVIELISAPGNPGKRIFQDRFWGDPGFIHIGFDIYEMDELREYCTSLGYPFVVDSMDSKNGDSFEMGDAAGHFAYIEDPDGILLEFVESHKLRISKRLGWYLNLKNKMGYKPLPGWLLKMLRFSRVKKI